MVADARVAAAGGGGGKSKKDKVENIMLEKMRGAYLALSTELARAGGVDDVQTLYKKENEQALAFCQVKVAEGMFEALPAGEPRFDEQPTMMARLLLILVPDESHMLSAKSADALWVPLVCDGALGGRGVPRLQLLPALHVVMAPVNPSGPFAITVRDAGRTLLTPRPASVVAGTEQRPALEVTEGDDGAPAWNTDAFLPSLTSLSAGAMQRHNNAVSLLLPGGDASMLGRFGASRVVCVEDGRPEKERTALPALLFADKVEQEARQALPGVEPDVYVQAATLAATMEALMKADAREREQKLNAAVATLVSGIAPLVRGSARTMVRNGRLRITLASTDDTAAMAVGVEARGKVVVPSPSQAGRALVVPGRAQQRAAKPLSKLLAVADALEVPAGSPLAWARGQGDAAVAEAVEVANIVAVLAWEAPEATQWNLKKLDVATVWGWQCPLSLVPAYEEACGAGGGDLLLLRCCRPYFAVPPPGTNTIAAARELKPEDACRRPLQDGSNVVVTVCMQPAVAGCDVGCAAGSITAPPGSHAHPRERTAKNAGRAVSIWEVSQACGDADAAAACELFAKRKYAKVWREGRSLPASLAVAYASTVPLYVGEQLDACVDRPTTRRSLLDFVADHEELSAEMSEADTWRACVEAGSAGAGGAAFRVRRNLRLPALGAGPRGGAPASAATTAAFGSLLAATEGAPRDAA